MKRKNTNIVPLIAITHADITRLNDGYRRAEQARTNYYWVSDFRNLFFKALGFDELLEQIDQDIAEYLDLSDEGKKVFLCALIKKNGMEVNRCIDKIKQPNGSIRPQQIALQDVCEAHIVKKTLLKKHIAHANEIQKTVEYVKDQNFKFGAFADDSENFKCVIDFVDYFVLFWKENSPLLDCEDHSKYIQYHQNYQTFKSSHIYMNFVK